MKKQDRFDKVPWTKLDNGEWSHISGAVVRRVGRSYPPKWVCDMQFFKSFGEAKQYVEDNHATKV